MEVWRGCKIVGRSCRCARVVKPTSARRLLDRAASFRRRRRRRPCRTPSCWAASSRRQATPCRIRRPPCCWSRGSGRAAPACSPCRSRREARAPARARTASRTSARRRTTASARSWLTHHPRVHAGQGQTLALIERVNRGQGLALPSTHLRIGATEGGSLLRPASRAPRLASAAASPAVGAPLIIPQLLR